MAQTKKKATKANKGKVRLYLTQQKTVPSLEELTAARKTLEE